MKSYLKLLASGKTVRTAFPVSLIVGTLLSAVNEGNLIVTFRLTPTLIARVTSNFVIPFLVASFGHFRALETKKS